MRIQMGATGKPKKSSPLKVSLGTVARENLPFPVVHYPTLYGTFLGFSRGESSPAALCSCAKPAVENLIRLRSLDGVEFFSDILANQLKNASQVRESEGEHEKTVPLFQAPLPPPFFPDVIAEMSIGHSENPLFSVQFVRGLCHRCNLTTPTLLYCHPMYGGRFMQHYGWYVNQVYLRLGISPKTFDYLPDICPPEHQEDILTLKRVIEEHSQASESFNQEYQKQYRDEDIAYWRERHEEMRRLHRKLAQTRRTLTRKIENITRQELGIRKVGEGWVSETILHQIVSRILADHGIIRHYRPEWLEGLELDIYVPDLKLALEYQGQQHFHPIKAWGGQKALEGVKARDARKVEICERLGIKLIRVDYTEPLTEDYIRMLISDLSKQRI